MITGRLGRFCAAVTCIAAAALAVLPGLGQAVPLLAPSFTLPLLDGKTLSLNDLRGSPVILLFWAPW